MLQDCGDNASAPPDSLDFESEAIECSGTDNGRKCVTILELLHVDAVKHQHILSGSSLHSYSDMLALPVGLFPLSTLLRLELRYLFSAVLLLEKCPF